jgi:hypothetical protein
VGLQAEENSVVAAVVSDRGLVFCSRRKMMAAETKARWLPVKVVRHVFLGAETKSGKRRRGS